MDLDIILSDCLAACEALIRAQSAAEARSRRAALHTALRAYVQAGGCEDYLLRTARARGMALGPALFA